VVWADDIPGGVEIQNAICNPDGTPKRYYSKSAMKAAAELRGVMPYHEVYAEEGEGRIKDAHVYEGHMKSGEYQRELRDRREQRRERTRH
jgi:hypothetical protein